MLSVRGSEARIGLPAPALSEQLRATVGAFLAIAAGRHRLIGVVTEVASNDEGGGDKRFGAVARVDMMGEIVNRRRRRRALFAWRIGLSCDRRRRADHRRDELRLVYKASSASAITIGALHNDDSIPACVDIDNLLTKHFAVLGSTGVGKSSGVAVILNEILDAAAGPAHFPARRPQRIRPLLRFARQRRQRRGAEAAVLAVQFRRIRRRALLRTARRRGGGRHPRRADPDRQGPLPSASRLDRSRDLAPDRSENRRLHRRHAGSLHDAGSRRADRRAHGQAGEPRLAHAPPPLADAHRRPAQRRALRLHVRERQCRRRHDGRDPHLSVPAGAERPTDDRPAARRTCPSEVVDAVVSVLCRLAFDFGLWSDGAMPMLFVCEEAHRYAAADRSVGFAPTRRALLRIAKEGRKYGVCLGLVTQRPAELDPTIISQCSTLFAMRMANDRDQALLRSAVTDAAANLVAFVPSLGTREVVGFGEGFPLPTRLSFKSLPADRIPRSETFRHAGPRGAPGAERAFVKAVVERWRGAAGAKNSAGEDPGAEADGAAKPSASSARRQPHRSDPRANPQTLNGPRRQAGDCGSWRCRMRTRTAPPARTPIDGVARRARGLADRDRSVRARRRARVRQPGGRRRAQPPDNDGAEREEAVVDGRAVLVERREFSVDGRAYRVSAATDIDDQRRLQDELFQRAYFDPLTKLPNRALLRRRGRAILRSAAGKPATSRWRSSASTSSTPSTSSTAAPPATRCCRGRAADRRPARRRRHGGANRRRRVCPARSPSRRNADAVRARIDRVLARFKRPLLCRRCRDPALRLRRRQRVSRCTTPTAEGLIAKAEAALAQAKRRYSGEARLYDPPIARRAHERARLEQSLRLAIRDRSFACALQPKVDFRAGKIDGLEVLMRWRDENGEARAPGDSIAFAVNPGLMNEMTQLVFEETLASLDAIDAAFGPDLRLGFNIAAQQAGDIALHARIRRPARRQRPCAPLHDRAHRGSVPARQPVPVAGRADVARDRREDLDRRFRRRLFLAVDARRNHRGRDQGRPLVHHGDPGKAAKPGPAQGDRVDRRSAEHESDRRRRRDRRRSSPICATTRASASRRDITSLRRSCSARAPAARASPRIGARRRGPRLCAERAPFVLSGAGVNGAANFAPADRLA